MTVHMLMLASTEDARVVKLAVPPQHCDDSSTYCASCTDDRAAAMDAIGRARPVTFNGVGPEPASPLPWKRRGGLDDRLEDARRQLVAVGAGRYDDWRTIVYRVNGWDAAMARIAALEATLSRVAVVALEEGATGVQDIIGDECPDLYRKAVER